MSLTSEAQYDQRTGLLSAFRPVDHLGPVPANENTGWYYYFRKAVRRLPYMVIDFNSADNLKTSLIGRREVEVINNTCEVGHIACVKLIDQCPTSFKKLVIVNPIEVTQYSRGKSFALNLALVPHPILIEERKTLTEAANDLAGEELPWNESHPFEIYVGRTAKHLSDGQLEDIAGLLPPAVLLKPGRLA